MTNSEQIHHQNLPYYSTCQRYVVIDGYQFYYWIDFCDDPLKSDYIVANQNAQNYLDSK